MKILWHCFFKPALLDCSYGQMVLYPWGYDREDHEDEGELERVGQIGNAAMGNK